MTAPNCASRFASKFCLSIVACLSTLVTANAWGITRIGNAKFGSENLGFEGTLEKPFVFLREEANDGALFISMGDGILRDGEPLSVYPLDRALPESKELSRSEFRTLFGASKSLKSGWTELYAEEECVEAFVAPSQDKANFWGVASWGEGKGLVFFGSNKPSVSLAVKKMLQTLEVKQGACAWE